MPKYKQGYSDRKDESLGMKNGASRKMKQGYKDRRDESYGMMDHGMKKQGYKDYRDESYGMKDMGVMGHDKQPKSCNAFKAQKRDMGRVDVKRMDYRGSPDQAFDYKY